MTHIIFEKMETRTLEEILGTLDAKIFIVEVPANEKDREGEWPQFFDKKSRTILEASLVSGTYCKFHTSDIRDIYSTSESRNNRIVARGTSVTSVVEKLARMMSGRHIHFRIDKGNGVEDSAPALDAYKIVLSGKMQEVCESIKH